MADAAVVKRIFMGAINRPGSERSAFLDGACGDDAELRREVEALLSAHVEPPVLETTTKVNDSTIAAPITEREGSRIGPYKLLQQLGEGGFGVVFMADQEKPIRRRVALKIIKLGMDTHRVVARFEAERQALAMMDHPNIAKVLDAGATDSGRPFFVMELVKGDPITEYADRNNLSIEERLELFTQVCNAVQHAHTKGVIHRDIKPSNVLVHTLDGRPHAKIIDFGIAKATDQHLTEKTLFTEHKALIGTPLYMSPEQAEGSLDIDMRTDVYSLGVLLYELLTGSTPFDSASLRAAAYAEIQRIIREVDPPKPSTRLSSLNVAQPPSAVDRLAVVGVAQPPPTMNSSEPTRGSPTLADLARHRNTEPKKLGTLIRGELDWIVMKALDKDRARRYETANAFAADVNRHLSGEPVVAAPPSTAYRMRKFVRKHRGQVVAASFVIFALLLGMGATTSQAVRARQAEANQRGERAKTQKANEDLRKHNEVIRQAMECVCEALNGEQSQAAIKRFDTFLGETAKKGGGFMVRAKRRSDGTLNMDAKNLTNSSDPDGPVKFMAVMAVQTLNENKETAEALEKQRDAAQDARALAERQRDEAQAANRRRDEMIERAAQAISKMARGTGGIVIAGADSLDTLINTATFAVNESKWNEWSNELRAAYKMLLRSAELNADNESQAVSNLAFLAIAQVKLDPTHPADARVTLDRLRALVQDGTTLTDEELNLIDRAAMIVESPATLSAVASQSAQSQPTTQSAGDTHD